MLPKPGRSSRAAGIARPSPATEGLETILWKPQLIAHIWMLGGGSSKEDFLWAWWVWYGLLWGLIGDTNWTYLKSTDHPSIVAP